MLCQTAALSAEVAKTRPMKNQSFIWISQLSNHTQSHQSNFYRISRSQERLPKASHAIFPDFMGEKNCQFPRREGAWRVFMCGLSPRGFPMLSRTWIDTEWMVCSPQKATSKRINTVLIQHKHSYSIFNAFQFTKLFNYYVCFWPIQHMPLSPPHPNTPWNLSSESQSICSKFPAINNDSHSQFWYCQGGKGTTWWEGISWRVRGGNANSILPLREKKRFWWLPWDFCTRPESSQSNCVVSRESIHHVK